MTATQAREAIDRDFDSVLRIFGRDYAAGWRAALEWMIRKEEGEQ